MNAFQHHKLHEMNAREQIQKAQMQHMANELPSRPIRREKLMLMLVIVSFLILMVVS